MIASRRTGIAGVHKIAELVPYPHWDSKPPFFIILSGSSKTNFPDSQAVTQYRHAPIPLPMDLFAR